jgi:hypothetical protein
MWGKANVKRRSFILLLLNACGDCKGKGKNGCEEGLAG